MKFSFSGNQDIYLEIAERYKEYIRLHQTNENEVRDEKSRKYKEVNIYLCISIYSGFVKQVLCC